MVASADEKVGDRELEQMISSASVYLYSLTRCSE